MRPATPSECPGFLFDTWVTRNRHGRACPGHDDVGTDALEITLAPVSPYRSRASVSLSKAGGALTEHVSPRDPQLIGVSVCLFDPPSSCAFFDRASRRDCARLLLAHSKRIYRPRWTPRG